MFLFTIACALILSFGLTNCVPLHQKEDVTAMLRMLDGMQQMMTGEPQFDRTYYGQLRDCMATFDPQLTSAQDKAWQGIIDYWNMGGAEDDLWGQHRSMYMEHNVSVTDVDGMIIYEPCDYASNVAFYHDVTELCLRISNGPAFSWSEEYILASGISYSALGMGSSFWHGSNTFLGQQQDRHTLGLVAYLIHQGSLSYFSDAPAVLTDLQPEKRDKTALELNAEFLTVYNTLPVAQWYDTFEALDVPDYFLSFAGIFSTVFTICFPPEVVDYYVPILAQAFGLPEEYETFIMDSYLPDLRDLTSDIIIEDDVKESFLNDTVASMTKLIYAFLWQEEVLTNNTYFLQPDVNAKGAKLLPIVNEEADQVSDFQYYDEDYQKGKNIYPGDGWCNPVIPHAKWHLESGVGMLDVSYLGDEIYRIYSTSPRNSTI